ncbi:MAG: response regulator [Myxococcota bacterium]
MCQNAYVLVVDDDVDLRDCVALCLASAGFQVRSAGDGTEALQHLAESPPALIMLDMRMPRMDGRAFARELQVRHGPVAPIVVMTAAENAGAAAAEIGAAGVLGKPFDVDELLQTVERHLQHC